MSFGSIMNTRMSFELRSTLYRLFGQRVTQHWQLSRSAPAESTTIKSLTLRSSEILTLRANHIKGHLEHGYITYSCDMVPHMSDPIPTSSRPHLEAATIEVKLGPDPNRAMGFCGGQRPLSHA